MREHVELPGQETEESAHPVFIEENDPYLEQFREQVRQELLEKKPKQKPDEGLITYLAKIRMITHGNLAAIEEKKEKFRSQA